MDLPGASTMGSPATVLVEYKLSLVVAQTAWPAHQRDSSRQTKPVLYDAGTLQRPPIHGRSKNKSHDKQPVSNYWENDIRTDQPKYSLCLDPGVQTRVTLTPSHSACASDARH